MSTIKAIAIGLSRKTYGTCFFDQIGIKVSSLFLYGQQSCYRCMPKQNRLWPLAFNNNRIHCPRSHFYMDCTFKPVAKLIIESNNIACTTVFMFWICCISQCFLSDIHIQTFWKWAVRREQEKFSRIDMNSEYILPMVSMSLSLNSFSSRGELIAPMDNPMIDWGSISRSYNDFCNILIDSIYLPNQSTPQLMLGNVIILKAHHRVKVQI